MNTVTVWRAGRKHITYTCLNEPPNKDGKLKKCRDRSLSDTKYLKEAMENEFAIRKRILEAAEHGRADADERAADPALHLAGRGAQTAGGYVGWNNTRHERGGPRTQYRQNYNCVTYAKFGKRACTSHYISIKLLDQIVLADIRDKIQTVRFNEKAAREDFLRRSEQNQETVTSADKRKITQGKKRLDELDRLIAAAYEDKVIGRIPEEICVNLLSKYQEEKIALKGEIAEAETRIADAEKNRADVEEFIRRLKAYGDPT